MFPSSINLLRKEVPKEIADFLRDYQEETFSAAEIITHTGVNISRHNAVKLLKEMHKAGIVLKVEPNGSRTILWTINLSFYNWAESFKSVLLAQEKQEATLKAYYDGDI